MAVFPALRPGTRTYIAASYPGAVHTAYGGQESRVRTSNASSGARLRLQFPGISEAQMLEIASHYAGQRGRFYPFQLSDEALSGIVDSDALTPVGYQWIYVGSPKITDISEGTAASPKCVHDVELELELVPEVSTFAGGARWVATASFRNGIAANGNINLAGASWSAAAAMGGGIRTGNASGAAWTAAAAIAGGAASNGNIALSGASWSAAAVIVGGIRSNSTNGAAWTAAAAIAGGTATNGNINLAGASWSTAAAMGGGILSSNLPGAAWTAAAAIAGGGILINASATGATWSAAMAIAGGGGDGGVATDANFSSVSLLLHMDGSNGSTTFSDNSSAARTVTVYGNAQISTARSKFGGASGLFDGSGDYLGTTISGGLGSGNFTVEFWYYKTANSGTVFTCRTSGSGADGFDMDADISMTTQNNYLIFDDYSGRLTLNTWKHVAVTRSSNTLRRFIDGTLRGSTTWSANLTGTSFLIGGSPYGSAGYLTGNIDDFRITVGVARYISSFTPPVAAFPNS
jgi:hypothetical protein